MKKITILNFILIFIISGCDVFSGNKTPEQVGNEKWADISADDGYTCGVRDDKSIKCFGMNDFNQLTANSFFKNTDHSDNSLKFKNIYTGRYSACAISEENYLWCWGSNSLGQVGNDDKTNKNDYNKQSMPVLVNDFEWKSVSLSKSNTCGIKNDNTLWCWGDNKYGHLGDGTYENPNDTNGGQRVPKQIDKNNWSSLSISLLLSCGLKTDNTLWCWGKNDVDINNNMSDLLKPELFNDIQFEQISIGNSFGGYFICGIGEDNSLWCWGSNNSGQLGDGTKEDKENPVKIGSDRWKSVSTGWNYACALKEDNSLWCWGNNEYFKLGDGTEKHRTKPKKIGGNSKWLKISTGWTHTCGLKDNNTLWCWGSNQLRQF